MRGVVHWMNSSIGRAVMVGIGFAIAMLGLVLFEGVTAVAILVLGLVVLIVGAGLGTPFGVAHRDSRDFRDGTERRQ